MATMIRKQIYLDEASDKALRAEARRRGMSQAAVIRERLAAPGMAGTTAIHDPAARERLLERLRHVAETAAPGPGTGWKFDRGEIYEERLRKARPAGHERAGLRRGRARAG